MGDFLFDILHSEMIKYFSLKSGKDVTSFKLNVCFYSLSSIFYESYSTKFFTFFVPVLVIMDFYLFCSAMRPKNSKAWDLMLVLNLEKRIAIIIFCLLIYV